MAIVKFIMDHKEAILSVLLLEAYVIGILAPGIQGQVAKVIGALKGAGAKVPEDKV